MKMELEYYHFEGFPNYQSSAGYTPAHNFLYDLLAALNLSGRQRQLLSYFMRHTIGYIDDKAPKNGSVMDKRREYATIPREDILADTGIPLKSVYKIVSQLEDIGFVQVDRWGRQWKVQFVMDWTYWRLPRTQPVLRVLAKECRRQAKELLANLPEEKLVALKSNPDLLEEYGIPLICDKKSCILLKQFGISISKEREIKL